MCGGVGGGFLCWWGLARIPIRVVTNIFSIGSILTCSILRFSVGPALYLLRCENLPHSRTGSGMFSIRRTLLVQGRFHTKYKQIFMNFCGLCVLLLWPLHSGTDTRTRWSHGSKNKATCGDMCVLPQASLFNGTDELIKQLQQPRP